MNGADIRFVHLGITIEHLKSRISVFGFRIAFYGIIIGIGMLAGIWIAQSDAKRRGQDPELYLDFAMYAIICSIVGARIYYVIFEWEYYSQDLSRIFAIREGGLAIYGGFLCSILIFGQLDETMLCVLLGAAIIVALGIFDDVLALGAKLKFVVQIVAAAIPVCIGDLQIGLFTNLNPLSDTPFVHHGILAVPVTIIWIVGITNAVNLIDGLDGLAVGVSSIAAITMLAVALLTGNMPIAITMAALAGACIGFMPYNLNPAKIFMGDTGSTFLGYMLATVSIMGLFKFYAVISFAVPFLILGLPIFDTANAIIRRVAAGRSPMSPDRGHVHHKLIDMGFNQKQAVAILYAISATLGLTAVVLTSSGEVKAIVLLLAVLAAVAGPCKMVYAPMLGLCLLIPMRKFGKVRNWFISAFAVGTAWAMAMYLVNSQVIATYAAATEADSYVEWAGEAGFSMSLLIHNPVLLVRMFYQTLLWNAKDMHITMIGGWLGNLDQVLDVPYLAVWAFTLCLIGLALKIPGEQIRMNMRQRVWTGFLCAACGGLTMLSMLIAWTPVSSRVILGVQGRYFLPFLPVLLLALKNRTVVLTKDKNRSILYLMCCLNGYALVRLFSIVCIRL